jgi:hypothetical protein
VIVKEIEKRHEGQNLVSTARLGLSHNGKQLALLPSCPPALPAFLRAPRIGVAIYLAVEGLSRLTYQSRTSTLVWCVVYPWLVSALGTYPPQFGGDRPVPQPVFACLEHPETRIERLGPIPYLDDVEQSTKDC